MSRPEGARPLEGLGILVTRPEHQSADLAARLTALGAEVHAIPTIEILSIDDTGPLDEAIRDLSKFAWLVFTSVNGVEFFFDRLVELGCEVPGVFGHLKIAAIGPSTRRSIEKRCVEVDCMPKEHRAEALLDLLVSEGVAKKKVLIPRARIARDLLPEGLIAAQAQPTVVAVYETICPEGSREALQKLFDGSRIHVVTFTSRSTVDAFHRLAPCPLPQELLFAAIGPVTAHAAAEQGYRTAVVAEQYTVDGLVEAIASHFESRTLSETHGFPDHPTP